MEIVITMAGLGTRFLQAGYKEPKYRIKALGKTLFEWSMDSLAAFRRPGDRYTFIVRREDQASDFISGMANELGIAKAQVLELSEPTDGQATTALLASSLWNRDDELYIYNIDTYVEPFSMTPGEIHGDGFIPCFSAPGEHWSFVRLSKDQDLLSQAVEVREKKRISEHCTLGAYYFRSCGLYEQLYNEYYGSRPKTRGRADRVPEPGSRCETLDCGETNGGDSYAQAGSSARSEIDSRADDSRSEAERRERYIAPLYDYMIQKGMEVYISSVPEEKVHVLGTPEELDAFIRRVQ
ncbi:MAG: glycosyltransferase family 2 protein [Lachnospiraceae bacterium]|nr:glycosyltransferase family 2 protein [Lachnospiraceae bacterium]